MPLNKTELFELCEIAKEAAAKAAKVIQKYQNLSVEVKTKNGGENIASQVVTEVDFQAQEAIVETISPSLEKYDLGLLTEESTDNNSRFEKEHFWCIDPLDGTLAFSRNEDGYSTSIALVSRDGVPLIGVVYNPRNNTMYHTIKGSGAFKNDSPLKVQESSRTLTLLLDQSYYDHPEFERHIESLKSNLESIGLEDLSIFPLGGAVMNGISTIDCAPAVYYKLPKKPLGGGSLWDFAASSVIQSEAGGFNSDFFEQPLDLNRADSTFMNHKGVKFCSSKRLLDFISMIK